MTYCYKCGAKLDEGTIFCPSCGTRQPNTGSKSESEGNIFDKVKDTIKDTPDYSSQIDPRDVNDNKLFAILAYFGLLVLVPIFAAPKKSRYARFHANQGLVLMIFDAVYNVITSIINTALGLPRLISIFGNGGTVGDLVLPSIVSTVLSLFSIVFLVLSVIGIINAATGKCKELPIIGKIRLLK